MWMKSLFLFLGVYLILCDASSLFLWCLFQYGIPLIIWHWLLMKNVVVQGKRKWKEVKCRRENMRERKKIDCQEILTFRITLHVKKTCKLSAAILQTIKMFLTLRKMLNVKGSGIAENMYRPIYIPIWLWSIVSWVLLTNKLTLFIHLKTFNLHKNRFSEYM